MFFENVYFVNGTAYAGKSTLVKELAERHGGILCEENYQDQLLDTLDKAEFPCLTYTRDLVDWQDFVRRTPDQYEAWIKGVTLECEQIELRILEGLPQDGRPIFVDTNVTLETLKKIVPHDHVLIMLAEPDISVNLFFNRPDKEKQFLYRLILEEPNPEAALENFRQCLSRINSQENYDKFLNSGFNVLLRDENRAIDDTVKMAEKLFGLDKRLALD